MDGTRVLSMQSVGDLDLQSLFIGCGDYGGDRRDDIVWQTPDGILETWYMDGVLRDTVRRGYSASKWSPIGSGDLSGDGVDDPLFQHTRWNHFSIWSIASIRNAAPIVADSSAPGISPSSRVAIRDFAGNGKADILWRDDDRLRLSQNSDVTGVRPTRDVDQTIETSWQAP